MPRSSQSSLQSRPRAVAPFRPTVPTVSHSPLQPYSPPTTGQILKESVVSGVGAGVGMNIANRMMTSIFGAPQVAVTQTQQTPTPGLYGNPNAYPEALTQCMEHMATEKEELPLCLFLMKRDRQYDEFHQCMQSSQNQIHLCKDFLPKQ
jgi:hypothetical protein